MNVTFSRIFFSAFSWKIKDKIFKKKCIKDYNYNFTVMIKQIAVKIFENQDLILG